MSISKETLESYLWSAATYLRGHIDSGDYKQYIFPLLFYKRLCDVYDEEEEEAINEFEGNREYANFSENHRFVIPSDHHWNDVRSKSVNIGNDIQKAFRAIEASNHDLLSGVFGDAQWTNKDVLPDSMLKELIEHFSTQNLSVKSCPEDELGVGYEFLIKRFADDSGHTAAEFYTNRTVVHLMTELLEPSPGESIYDPTCGSAGMLLSAVSYLKRMNREYRSLKLYGQEINLLTSAIGKMNMILHGIEDFCIMREDTLTYPQFIDKGKLKKFDVVLANPPYSIKKWNRASWANDPWGRNIFGTPPQGRADYAFWQHILASMKSNSGRCAVLFPHGVLFRNEEHDMRAKLVEADILECVIGLGPNLFYNSPMEACIVICRSKKVRSHRGRILFIDAVDEVTRERAQSFISEKQMQRIASTYHSFESGPVLSCVKDIEGLRKKNYNLSISAHVSNNNTHKTNLNNEDICIILEEYLAGSHRVAELLDQIKASGINNDSI